MKTKRIIAMFLIAMLIIPTAYAKGPGGGAIYEAPGSGSGGSGGSGQTPTTPQKPKPNPTQMQDKKIIPVSESEVAQRMKNLVNNAGPSGFSARITLSKNLEPKRTKTMWEKNGVEYVQYVVTPAVYAVIDSTKTSEYNANYKTLHHMYNIKGPSSLLRHRSNPNAPRGDAGNYDNSTQSWNSPNNKEFIFVPADTRAIGTYTITNTPWKKWDVMSQLIVNYSYFADYGPAHGGVQKIKSAWAVADAKKTGEAEGPGTATTTTLTITTQDIQHIIPVQQMLTEEDVKVEVETELIQ